MIVTIPPDITIPHKDTNTLGHARDVLLKISFRTLTEGVEKHNLSLSNGYCFFFQSSSFSCWKLSFTKMFVTIRGDERGEGSEGTVGEGFKLYPREERIGEQASTGALVGNDNF